MKFDSYVPNLNYYPLRQVFDGLFNISAFEKFQERTNFAHLVNVLLGKANRKDDVQRGKLVKLNLRALRALYDWAEENEVYGVSEKFGEFLFRIEGGIKPFIDAVIFVKGKPYLVFLDIRGSNYLTPEGRKFVLSVMHQHIRLRYPDLEEAGLAILHLEKHGDARRVNFLSHDESKPLYEISMLEEMVREMFEEIAFTKAA